MNCPGKQPQSRDTRHIQKPLHIHTTKCNPNKDILTTVIGLNFPPLTLLSYPQKLPSGEPHIYINLETGRTSTFTPHHVISIENRKSMLCPPPQFVRANRTFKHIHLI